MVDCGIDGTVYLFLRNVSSFARAPIQELLEFLGDCGAIAGWGDLLGRNGDHADFLVGVDVAA